MSSAARQPIADLAESTAPRASTRTTSPAPAALRVIQAFARWWGTPVAFDVTVWLVYAAFAFWITQGLWPSPATRAIADNVNDQALIEWFLAHGVLIWKGDFSFVTDRLNSPDGVNLMSNASHILHGAIMAPVTATLGAPVSFALLVALNLAATAGGWYLLLARGLGLHRGAAILAGAITGFAPGMISQSNSHLHMTAQWLVPPIVYCVIRLTRVQPTRDVIVTGAGLGLLIAAQLLLGEEVLFLTALTLALFTLIYALRRRRWARTVARRFTAGMLIAAGVALLLCAYPIAIQVAGRQHTPNAPFAPDFFYADVASFADFSPLSLAGPDQPSPLATSSTEYNTFLGLPLILVVLALIIWRFRSPVIMAIAGTGVIMTLLSFGPNVTYNGERTGLPSLYQPLGHLPLVSGALPTRYALALIPLIAVLFAIAVSEALRAGTALRRARVLRWVVPVAAIAAVLPTMPVPLAATDRDPVPTFISSGAWRQCAPAGGVIVPVPLPTPGEPDTMRWPAAANAAFAIPEGFFIGPYAAGGRSSVGTYPRPTSALLAEVAKTGSVPTVDEAIRAQAQKDLSFWRADCVALAHVPAEPQLRQTLEEILGPAQATADTWTWKITR